MKTYVYLFFCLFSLMGFQACGNDEVDNVKTTTSNDVEAVIERIERAFYFLLSICGAYIMSSLKEAKNIKISKRTKKIIILSFIGALFSIFVFFFLENIYLGCIIASMIAIYPFSLIYKEQKC